MKPTGQQKAFFYITCLLLTGGILAQVYRLADAYFVSKDALKKHGYLIDVHGHVNRPGKYRVAPGTSQFEILQVAGIRPRSDISTFNLTQQVDNQSRIAVDSMEEPATLKESEGNVRLEFFFGELNIVSADGRSRPRQEGLGINPGDRLITEAQSQAELSVNSFSRVDLDDFTEVLVEKIGAPEGNKRVVEFFQKSGIAWYKMAYTNQSELHRIITPFAVVSVGGSGADFMIESKYDELLVHNIDGLLLIERPGGEEAINLISGQTAVCFSDARPFQVRTLAADVSPNEKFSELIKEKTNYMVRHMPLNMLYCAIPSVYHYISVDFERGIVHVVSLPNDLSVLQFAQGIQTLDQALLSGGPVFTSTIVERIMDSRIDKHVLMKAQDVVGIVDIFGGIEIDVDAKAASHLNLPTGKHTLSSAQLLIFLKPSISGWDDSRQRQYRVLEAVYESIKLKSLVVTAVLAQQIISKIKTNFAASDVMAQYQKFIERKNWQFKTYMLPVQSVNRKGRIYKEPDLKKCRELLYPEK
ncbi:MAG: hypothetical protein GF398_11955 [Chitinivibrionales bacterium]|nr:hypothetical protein [Chitinivibrionales bacterium]